MLSYTHFTHDERICLHNLVREGLSIRQIACRLGRSPSTISRELKRNSSSKGYHHWRAQILTICRRRHQHRTALPPGSPQYDYTLEKLQCQWPPEAIANCFRLENPGQTLSTSTIYRAIRRGAFPGVSARKNLRRRGKNRHYVHHNTKIQPTRLIPEWPEAIRNRSRLGDFEGDTVYGAVGKGLLVTLVDRRSRFLLAGKISSRNATETREMMQRLLAGHTVRSISLDNGTEFAEFRLLEQNVGVPVYFAEPHKPWQRGTNENTNGLLRFFFPKGSDFRTLTQAQLDVVVDLLNDRPRKCLGWKSPREVFVALA